MAEMKDSGIEWVGKIPENWKVLKNKYNFVLSKEIIGTKWVETQLLSLTKYGIKAINDGEQTGKVPASLSTYQKVNKDDLVMCLFDLDCSAVFSGISNFDGMISPAYKCIKCKAHLFPKYIDYYFKTVFVDRKYKRYSKNVRFSISADEFMNLPIIIPPKDMQINIAKFLDKKCREIDALHTDIEKQIETLEEYKKSIITEAVTKGLDPDVEMKNSGIEWIGMIPKDWSTIRIGHVFSLRNERNSLPEDQVQLLSLYTGIGVFPQGEHVTASGNHAQTVDGYKIVHKNDIVVNIILAWMGAIGVSDYDGVTSPAYDIYIPDLSKVVPHYFHYVFRTAGIAGECYKYGRGIMMMRWRTYSQEFKQIFVPFPSLEKQQEIAEYLDKKCAEIDGAIEEKKQQLETLEQYKKSVIYEYVTGKKEVQ